MKSIKKTLCAVLIFGSCLKPDFIKADNITTKESIHKNGIISKNICNVCYHLIAECICRVAENVMERGEN